jgi:inorganic pyrophosphatase
MDMKKLSRGNKFPEEVNVFIEVPQGSSVKYELDKESGAMFVDRFMYTAMAYPFNYGFIPETSAGDGDPVDVLVISSMAVSPGTIIPSRPIGLLEMEDEEGIDTKILAVPTAKVDPFYSRVNDIGDVAEAVKGKIRHFFEHYKELEKGKWVKLKNFKNKKAALEDIKKAV